MHAKTVRLLAIIGFAAAASITWSNEILASDTNDLLVAQNSSGSSGTSNNNSKSNGSGVQEPKGIPFGTTTGNEGSTRTPPINNSGSDNVSPSVTQSPAAPECNTLTDAAQREACINKRK